MLVTGPKKNLVIFGSFIDQIQTTILKTCVINQRTVGEPWRIIHQNFMSMGLAILEEIANKQTHAHIHLLTSYCP